MSLQVKLQTNHSAQDASGDHGPKGEDLAKMHPDEKEVLNTLMAQVDALELVLKMVISVQLATRRISQR